MADDDGTLRSAVCELLESQPDIEVVGQAADAETAADAAMELRPDVALLDVRMPGGGGPAAARRIRQLSPATRMVALSALEDRESMLTMVRAGAVGYLVKGSATSSEIVAAVRAAARVAGATDPSEPAARPGSRPAGEGPIPATGGGAPLRVLVAGEDGEVLTALADCIAGDERLELAGAAEGMDDALRLALTHRPDLALVDRDLLRFPAASPDSGGMDERLPDVKVAPVSVRSDRSALLDSLSRGATSHITSAGSTSDLVARIRRTAETEMARSGAVGADVVLDLVVQLERAECWRESRRRQRERIQGVLAGEGLQVVLQPVRHLRTGRLVGVEALARFPGGPPRSPDVWFREAAAVGLGVELELVAIRAALGKLVQLPDDVFLAVNLSPATILSDRTPEVFSGPLCTRLVAELSEASAVADYDELNTALAKLRSRGVRIAADDVGAGFSVPHLLRLTPDFVKLDITICAGVDGHGPRLRLASALASFAKDIGAAVIAEGIETPREAAALDELGIPYGQGFLLDPPESFT